MDKTVLEPLEIWELAMADISQKLLIKYGLSELPTKQKSEEWVILTQEFIKSGLNKDQSGESAAKALFKDYRTRAYASQADTIEMLLSEAAKK